MRFRGSDIGLLRAAGIILRPARRPLIQLIAAFGIAVSLPAAWITAIRPVVGEVGFRYAGAIRQLNALTQALEMYRADCGRYPSASEGLEGLVFDHGVKGWKGPYWGEFPIDPWGRPYAYVPSQDPPEVISFGADGKPGGEGLNGELSSRDPLRTIKDGSHVTRARRIRASWLIVALTVFVGSLYALIRAH